jgi:CubicO group peptidase (beta-lactamase class C family)
MATAWPSDAPADTIFPNKEWHRSTPEAQGIDSNLLADMLESLLADNPGIHGIMIVRHGVVILDLSFYPYASTSKHDIASCTKTVTALTLGKLIDQGTIAGVDTKLVDCFPKRTIAQLDDRKRAVKLQDLLTMRSGLGFFQQTVSQLAMFQSPDWVAYCLNVKVVRPPGEIFEYFNGNPHLLSAVITAATQRPADQIANEDIFKPIGITDFAWPRDPQGVSWGWGDLRLATESMARLGLLVLHQGQWNGQPVLSTKWIEDMTTPHVQSTGNKRLPYYGYQIWLADRLIAFQGRGGQRIWIDRAHDLVAVTTAGASRAQQDTIDDLWPKFILPAIKENPLPELPEAQNRLRLLIKRATTAPAPQPINDLPAVAKEIDGVRFKMSPNPYAEAVQVSFLKPSEAELQLDLPAIHRHPNLKLIVGLDGVPRLSPGRYGEPAALTGKWKENTLEIDFDELANINHWKIKLTFTPPTVRLDMSEGTELPPIRSKGTAIPKETPSSK